MKTYRVFQRKEGDEELYFWKVAFTETRNFGVCVSKNMTAREVAEKFRYYAGHAFLPLDLNDDCPGRGCEYSDEWDEIFVEVLGRGDERNP